MITTFNIQDEIEQAKIKALNDLLDKKLDLIIDLLTSSFYEGGNQLILDSKAVLDIVKRSIEVTKDAQVILEALRERS